MKRTPGLSRQAHFLGTKIRNLRKHNGLTMEDLSSRCVKIDRDYAPSVSYLSMIERGKRVPSEDMLQVIAQVFQKDARWFLDDTQEEDSIQTVKSDSKGGLTGMPLEPSFLFSKDILQIALPELLAQTGTNGRQFSQLLIRAFQEHHQNHFPDLERAAEEIGRKQLPLTVDALIDIAKNLGLTIQWYKKAPQTYDQSSESKGILSSFFERPNIIYLNEVLRRQTRRLKYDLAVHIGHFVLHNGDGLKRRIVAGAGFDESMLTTHGSASADVDPQDIVHAWRNFECSFFAGALLCPKTPFRQALDRNGYDVNISDMLDVSPSVIMRRMTAVSPYPYWHYFDAYDPGILKAVYRGNGIPLPWGNMRAMEDPCSHWAVFRMLNEQQTQSSQISIMNKAGVPTLYACESLKVTDLAGNNHVICSGIDLNPALNHNGIDAVDLVSDLQQQIIQQGGSGKIPQPIHKKLTSIAKILNINWVQRGLDNGASLICTRKRECPRKPSCGKCSDTI